MFLRTIRVRDVNRYLRPVVKQLKEKHVKVTNPDFEIELEAITGIKYRMAKSYLYNPNPWQKINDNAKIKRFVLERIKKDLFYRLRVPFCFFLALLASLLGFYEFLQLSKEPIIGQNEPSQVITTNQVMQENLKDVGPSGIRIEIPDIGLTLDTGLDVSVLKKLKHIKEKIECEHLNPNDAKGHNVFTICSYRYSTDSKFNAPDLKINFLYNRINKKIYQYIVTSTVPVYVDILKAIAKKEISKKFTLVKKDIIEKYKIGQTVQWKYVNESHDLMITETQLTKNTKPIKGMVGAYSINISSQF